MTDVYLASGGTGISFTDHTPADVGAVLIPQTSCPNQLNLDLAAAAIRVDVDLDLELNGGTISLSTASPLQDLSGLALEARSCP